MAGSTLILDRQADPLTQASANAQAAPTSGLFPGAEPLIRLLIE